MYSRCCVCGVEQDGLVAAIRADFVSKAIRSKVICEEPAAEVGCSSADDSLFQEMQLYSDNCTFFVVGVDNTRIRDSEDAWFYASRENMVVV
jgi:hypothetical protein